MVSFLPLVDKFQRFIEKLSSSGHFIFYPIKFPLILVIDLTLKPNVMRRFLTGSALILLMFTTACTTSKKQKPMKKKQNYVLVHSAWLGGWQWDAVKPIIAEKGHNVYTPDLQGHGQDKTTPGDISMESYVETLLSLIDSIEGPVVLVGHSFNGITVSRVAELRPKKISKLVYVAAFLLGKGGSFFEAVQGVSGSEAVENFYLSEDKTYAMVKPEAIHSAFAHDVPIESFNAVKGNIVPEPAAPLAYRLEVSEANWGSIPKYYIECTEDRAIPIEVQRAMYTGNVVQSYTLNSSHTPNFSQPNKLAAYLLEIGSE